MSGSVPAIGETESPEYSHHPKQKTPVLVLGAIGVVFGGVLLIMFSFGLFGWAWRLYQRSKTV